jgi:hypothetical protein
MCFAKSHIYLARKNTTENKSHILIVIAVRTEPVLVAWSCCLLASSAPSTFFTRFFVPIRTTQTDSIQFLAITNGFSNEIKH